ncbi:MAG: sulfurtransferase [Burkholderiales bacterium]|nr:sulfurtransferase [Burkholderiales bacterium]
MSGILNIATYRFVAIPDTAALKAQWLPSAKALGLKGTILLANEGINLFLAGAETAIRSFMSIVDDDPRFANLDLKESWSDDVPFKRLKIKIKREIVTFRQAGLDPVHRPAPFMPPAELKRRLDAGEALVLLDTRNDVEVAKGTFDHALFWGNRNFTEFGEIARQHVDELKGKTVVSFCTGGIRCEKAAPYLQQLGVDNVYQLEGGILRYFEHVGRDHFHGDCFVFDERAALDPHLAATEHASA